MSISTRTCKQTKMNLLRYALIAGTVVLTGCSTVPKEVLVPVPVLCKTVEPVQPDYRFVTPYENIFDATRDLLGDRVQSLAYEEELRAALRSCK